MKKVKGKANKSGFSKVFRTSERPIVKPNQDGQLYDIN